MIPVTIVGGYLGAGKTTLINSLLRDPAGRRVAVLVNDFGGINIDAALIASSNATTIALTNGCACCVLSDDLGEAFRSVASATPAFDEIIVEASGVADPRQLAEWANLPGLRLKAVAVLADVTTIVERLDDVYLGKTIRRQLQGADFVVLTKTALANEEVTARATQLISQVAPLAPIRTPCNDQPWAMFEAFQSEKAPHRSSHTDDHSSVHVASTFQFTRPVAVKELEACLGWSIPGLVRAKGFVPMHGSSAPSLLQVVGSAIEITPVGAAGDSADGCSIVVIGIGGVFDVEQFTLAVAPLGLARV